MGESDEMDISTSMDHHFDAQRLNILYGAVEKVFMHNSMAQYVRDIIVAIRLHPDVQNGCSSFRANKALNVGAKFTNFIARLDKRCKVLRNINSDALVSKIHFVRPKDVDNIAIQILAHRI